MERDSRLGPYEVLEQLGAGGMGEVWLAEDTRLGRKVAIKVLPDEFSRDPERLARFEQEARAAAALNHPHIAAVYDVGEEVEGDGTIHFMVQEYLEGETLRDLLDRRGALELKQALPLALQLAQALRAAHAAGIVHRDLKPENVFVTEGDHAKILDFGLAKLTEGGPAGDHSATMSPTVLGTMAGQVMGTAGYMAPEQVNGEPVDGRTDLFAFGCLLYEMTTGERAFAGDNVHETLSRILSRDPVPVTEKRRDLPFTLGWIVDKSLAKDPGRRYQSAGDLAVDLARLQEQVGGGVSRSVAAVGALALAVAAVGATWWITRPSATTPPPVQRFEFPTTPASDFSNINNKPIAISPDGRTLVFVADENDDGIAHLWRRSIDELEIVKLRNTLEPRSPTFSHDGEELAFWSEPDEIVRMPATGGSPVAVAPLGERPYGISWGLDGNLWVGRGPRGVWSVPATGGDLEQVVALQEGESAYGPRLLPDGDRVLFTLRRPDGRWDEADLVVWSLSREEMRVVMQGGRDGRITPSGHLIYSTGNVLMGRPIDPETLEVTGGAVALVDPVPTSGGDLMGGAFYDVSETGTLVWTTGASFAGDAGLAWVDLETGTVERLADFDSGFRKWRLSPDGERIAANFGTAVSVLDIARGGQQQLGEPGDGFPVWSPDGEWIYHNSTDADGAPVIERRRSDFSGSPEVVVGGGEQTWAYLIPTDVSRDGEWLLYIRYGVTNDASDPAEIARLRLKGDEPASETILTARSVEDARLSPDGRLIAYSAMGTNNWEVYVHDIASGARVLASIDGGRYPTWSQDGSAIYYIWGGPEFSAKVETEPRLRVSPPERLVESAVATTGSLEPTPDGERVLVGVFAGADSARDTGRVFVTLNWFEELRRRVVPTR